MEIYFKTKRITALCNDDKKMSQKYGDKSAKELRKRLSQLYSFNKLGAFSFDNPHPLKGKRRCEFSITIYAGLRLVLGAAEPIPQTLDGAIDWDNVEKINIISIEDYH